MRLIKKIAGISLISILFIQCNSTTKSYNGCDLFSQQLSSSILTNCDSLKNVLSNLGYPAKLSNIKRELTLIRRLVESLDSNSIQQAQRLLSDINHINSDLEIPEIYSYRDPTQTKIALLSNVSNLILRSYKGYEHFDLIYPHLVSHNIKNDTLYGKFLVTAYNHALTTNAEFEFQNETSEYFKSKYEFNDDLTSIHFHLPISELYGDTLKGKIASASNIYGPQKFPFWIIVNKEMQD